ncbi:MAG: DUF1015 domain-containing protein [Acidobacteriota bacterium]|nr:MAG: DUF1015 domain-containing protein [Acidobacteriota bacterium]
MARIEPFRALRPKPEIAKSVSCVPYDVVYESEVREHITGNPNSFLRVTRAEAEFPAGSGPDLDDVFAKARENLEAFIHEGILIHDEEPAFFVYQLAAASHTQTGLVACCSLDEYEEGNIKKHEKTRPDKVDDRTRHLLAVNAQTGLIFLAFRGTRVIHELLLRATETEPIYEFECPTGIRQRVWRVSNISSWKTAFAEVPALYIADGHHRAESAETARQELRSANPTHNGTEPYNFVIAGLFPAEDLRILPYNRVIKDLNGLSEEEFLEQIATSFLIEDALEKVPRHHGEICMYMGGKWRKLRFNVQYFREPDPIERLDVSILHNFLLAPILGIGDERTDKRIGFVGGIRGTAELERLVDEGTAKLAFSMFPTTMDDLLAVADMGEIMPPKSTWFEPKLKDGLLIHQL